MANDVLTVIIDERKHLETLDDLTFLSVPSHRARPGYATRQKVFKDYILDQEPFVVGNHYFN